MNKLSLAAVSLVAAIPGGVLAVLMALVFLRHAEHMKTGLLVLAGLTLAVSALVTVMPLGILIFGSTATKKSPKKSSKKSKPDPEDEANEHDADSGDDQGSEIFSESDEMESGEMESDEMESGEMEFSDSDANLELSEEEDDIELTEDMELSFSEEDFEADEDIRIDEDE